MRKRMMMRRKYSASYRTGVEGVVRGRVRSERGRVFGRRQRNFTVSILRRKFTRGRSYGVTWCAAQTGHAQRRFLNDFRSVT